MVNEEVIQILANLYPEAIPAEAYEDVVALVVTRLRADMFRKKKLVNGLWIDADGTASEPVNRLPEMLAASEPPKNGIRGGGRRYDLPNESNIRDLAKADASLYPSVKEIAAKVQRELSAGKLRVHDSALRGNEPVVRIPGNGGADHLVPRSRVPENELRKYDRAEEAVTASRFKYTDPIQVQVGAPKAVSHAAPGERMVSIQDVMNGPSIPRPVG